MTARTAIAVAAVWGAGGLFARLLLGAAPTAIAHDLAQPVPVVFGWRWFGLAYLALLILTAVAGSLVAVRAVASDEYGPGSIASVTLAACCGMLAWPALLSSDPYAYAAFGANAAGRYDNAIAQAAAWQWGRALPPDNYGPLFNAFAAALLDVSGDNVFAAITLFRIAAFLSLVAGATALFAVLDGPRAERGAAALSYALNPIALWSAGEGHNDLFALALVLAALAIAKRFPLAGGFFAAAAALFKLPAALAAIAVAAGRRTKWPAFAIGVAAGLALVAVFSLPLLHATLARAGTGGEHTVPVLYPWYLAWFLPLLATAPLTRIRALVLAPVAFLTYAPDAFGTPSVVLRLGLSAIVAGVLVPLAVPAARALLSLRRLRT